jgi:hypothetical protein
VKICNLRCSSLIKVIGLFEVVSRCGAPGFVMDVPIVLSQVTRRVSVRCPARRSAAGRRYAPFPRSSNQVGKDTENVHFTLLRRRPEKKKNGYPPNLRLFTSASLALRACSDGLRSTQITGARRARFGPLRPLQEIWPADPSAPGAH